MTNLTFNIKIDSKFLIIFFASALGLFLFFNSKEVKAVSNNTLAGTYACLLNKNLGGFVKAKTGGTQGINAILLLTFTDGSNVVSFRGVSNQVSGFEGTTPQTVTTVYDQVGNTINYSATNIANLYKSTDPADAANGIAYFAVANSGNTLFMMGTPTTTSTDNAVCQRL